MGDLKHGQPRINVGDDKQQTYFIFSCLKCGHLSAFAALFQFTRCNRCSHEGLIMVGAEPEGQLYDESGTTGAKVYSLTRQRWLRRFKRFVRRGKQ